MSQAEKLLQDFYLISGMRVALYDKQARCIAWAGPTAYSYCNAVHTTAKGFNRCFASDEAAFATVAKTRKTHTFTCPFGLFEAVAPVINKGVLQGYLFVGEAIRQDIAQQELALREGSQFIGEGIAEQRLRTLIAQLATHTADEQQALVNTLQMFAAAIAATNVLDTEERGTALLLRDYLDRNYAQKITLSELALHFHYSTVTLTEHFKRAFDTTIVSYLTEKRIEAAKALLLETELNIGSVGERCGFENPEHFSKTFKQKTGLSPLHFRIKKGGQAQL